MSALLASWDLVKVYLLVMRTGSLSAAARHLKISQPTARRQIEALERELDVPLFTRGPQGLVATGHATELMAQAEAAEAAVGAFVRGASAKASDDAGTVRITCSEVYGVEILPPLLARLMHHHPGLQTELLLSNRADNLLNREADIAVRMVEPQQAALVARKVKPVALGFYATAEFLGQHPAPGNYGEFTRHSRFIADDRRSYMADGFQRHKMAMPQTIVLRTDSDLAQLAAIRAGIGIGICQCQLASRYGLVRILPDIELFLPSFVVMHEDLKTLRRARLVFDALVEALG